MEQTENKVGRFGEFGGQYIPETLMNEIKQLEKNYEFYKNDKEFNDELDTLLREYASRCRKDDKRSWRCKNLF